MATNTKRRSNSTLTPAVTKLWILFVILGIPIIIYLFSVGTKLAFNLAPITVTIALTILCGIYSGYVSGLVRKYYEIDSPFWRYIPCVGELSLTTGITFKISIILYIIAAVLFSMSLLPYDVVKIFGELSIQTIPFILNIIALVCLTGVQVCKGLGMSLILSAIENSWEETMKTNIGSVSKMRILMYIPFVRVIALYAISKPMSTLVDFMGRTTSDTDDVLAEED